MDDGWENDGREGDGSDEDDVERMIRKLGGEGILNPSDLPDLRSQRFQVLKLMSDRKWHNGLEVLAVAGGTEGLRRLRELRDIPGLEVRIRPTERKRVFEYLLVDDFDDMESEAIARKLGFEPDEPTLEEEEDENE